MGLDGIWQSDMYNPHTDAVGSLLYGNRHKKALTISLRWQMTCGSNGDSLKTIRNSEMPSSDSLAGIDLFLRPIWSAIVREDEFFSGLDCTKKTLKMQEKQRCDIIYMACLFWKIL